MAFDIALKSPNSAFDVVVGIPGAGSLVATRHRRGRSRVRAALSGLSTTYPSQPAAVQDGFTRSDFKVYLWPWDGSSNFQLDASGVTYYNNLGFGLTRDYYDIPNPNSLVLATAQANVDYWAGRSEWSYIDLWFLDIETTYYTGATGDTNLVPDLTSIVPGSKTQWSTHHATTMYVGAYLQYYCGYGSDASIGTSAAGQLDFSIPELYQTNIDSFKTAIDNYCVMKSVRGISNKLIPIVWVKPSQAAGYLAARLEYLIRKSAVDGVILWGTDLASAGPTYYDGYNWMQDAIAFVDYYGLTKGTPF